MQTTLTTSHWRTLQEMLLQQMEEKADRQISVLIAGMPFIAQGVQTMLKAADWINRVDVLAPQDEERFDVSTINADVLFLMTPGTSRLLGRIASRYMLVERSLMRSGGGVITRESSVSYPANPSLYPSEVIAADLALRAANRERRRQLAERGAFFEGDASTPPPGMVLMHISGAVSRDDIAISRRFGRPVSLHIRDGAKIVRTGVFAAANGLTYASPNAFANHPDLFVGYRATALQNSNFFEDAAELSPASMAEGPMEDGNDALPVADPSLWQMLSEQNQDPSHS